jgi:nucleotide-binding universal stress UspA family protein
LLSSLYCPARHHRFDLYQPPRIRHELILVKVAVKPAPKMSARQPRRFKEKTMAYKSILTVVTSSATSRHQIEAAVTLARQEDAHLDVLCLGLDRSQNGYYYVGATPLPPVILQESIDHLRQEVKATEAAVRQQLEAEDIRWSIDSGIAPLGFVGREVSLLARFADLVILPKPYGDGGQVDHETILESALFDGRAPVLLLPSAKPNPVYGKRIVIAWNQSDEAMAAIRAALPMLKSAANVSVAIIAPPAHGPERSDPGGMLSQFLARHDVHCEVSVLAKTLPHTSDVLCRHVEDISADMVVMGAYGHSRFREAILGGTTREMFEIAKVPVFTAH